MTRLIATAALLVLLGSPARAASQLPLTTSKGVVAADNVQASRVGARVLASGGNAADAAVATALALGVVSPASSGLGGGGFALIYVASERKTYVVDFREVAPAALTPGHFVRNGKVDTTLSVQGGLAVAVPGEVAGLAHITERFGRRSWRQVVRPAELLARNGFTVGAYLAELSVRFSGPELPGDPWFARWLTPGGRPLNATQLVRRPRLARALATIGRRGPKGFYAGWVADDVISTAARHGGVITSKDLETYRVAERQPLVGTWRGYEIATMPLPSSGGLVLLEVLGIVEATGINLAALGFGSSASIHVITEALKHGFADRARLLGDVDYSKVSAGALLDPVRLARLAKRINTRRIGNHEAYGDRKLGESSAAPARGGGTSHICVVDAEGNAVALTTTVNGWFGSKLVGKDSGIVLNNEVDDFTLAAGVPNLFGLVQSEANLVAGGKRPLSSMSPTLVLKDGKVVACVGGSGGPRIITNVLHALYHVFVFGMNAREAVEAPRYHHQWLPDQLYVERMPTDVLAGLRKRGHKLRENWSTNSAVQLILVREDGMREAASDPRKHGAPAAQ